MIHFPFFSAETWTLLITFLCLLILYGYWPYGIFKKLGIPGPKPGPFLGTLFDYSKGMIQMDMMYFETYGRIWGFYEGRQPALCTVDTKIIKTVLVKEFFSYFTNRRDFRFNGPLNDATSNARGEQWKQKRSLISPLFSSGRNKEFRQCLNPVEHAFYMLKRRLRAKSPQNKQEQKMAAVQAWQSITWEDTQHLMFPLMKRHSDKLVKCLQGIANYDEGLEVREYFGSYCLDALANIILSVETDSLNKPNDPIVAKMKKIFALNIENPGFLVSALFPFLNPLLEKANLCIFPLAETRFILSAIEKVKLDREKNVDKNTVDFLQMMFESQIPENENKEIKGLTHHEILATSLMFLTAGFETTSKSLAFLAYNLATNPGVIEKLHKEIDKVFPNKAPVTYEQLGQMEYLDMVLNESLRLYPIATRLERICTETIFVNGVTIPKGVLVMIPVYVLHHDPELWPEPDRFDPERFSKENKASIDPYSFLPFGIGPRNCVGMRFAVALMKLAIVHILQHFSFAPCQETEIPLKIDKSPLLGTVNPIKLKLVPRGPVVNEE